MTAFTSVNVGTLPNDGTGDPLRTAYGKLNANFGYFMGVTIPLNAVGNASVGSANEYGAQLEITTGVTSSLASYEKAGIYVDFYHQDPTAGAIHRDGVAIEGHGTIAQTNALGRVWALHGRASIESGGVGDGLLFGLETETNNNGTNQATVGTTTSKYGYHCVSTGIGTVTAGIFLESTNAATNGFNYGLYCDPTTLAANGEFLFLNGVFSVDKAGNIFTASSAQFAAENTPTQSLSLGSTAGLNSNISWTNSRLRVSNSTGNFSIGGFAQFGDGWRLYLYNPSANQMTIVNEDASSTAANRIKTLTGANVTTGAAANGSFATFSYDGTTQRWILESHS